MKKRAGPFVSNRVGLVLVVLASQSTACPRPVSPPHVNISDLGGNPAEAFAMQSMVDQGVLLTDANHRSRPEAPITRAELAMSVQHLFSLVPASGAPPFPDLSPGTPLSDSARAVAPYLGRQLLCSGCALGSKFLPDLPVSQLESAVLLTGVLRAQNKIQLLSEKETEDILAGVPEAATFLGSPLRVRVATAIHAGVIASPTQAPGVMQVQTRGRTAVTLYNLQRTYGLPLSRPVN